MRMPEDSVKRYQLIIGILFAIACIGYLLVIYFFGIDSEVMRDRFRNANALLNGGPLEMEYPPFAIVFMVIPRLFASTEYAYNVAYVAEVFVFFMIGLYFIAKLAERFRYSPEKAVLVYGILMLLMLEFVVDRYDVFPAVMTLISFYLFATKRYAWAFILLSLGTMTKLYPALLLPIYVTSMASDRDRREIMKGVMAFMIAALAVAVPMMLMDSGAISYFIEYHADRPLQIESIVASLIYPFSMAGITEVWITYTFGSDNLMGPWPDAIAPMLTPLMILSVLLAYAVYAHILVKGMKCGAGSMKALGCTVMLAIVLFMVIGKVFSSQYLIWIIPPLIFMLMVSGDPRFNRNLVLLTIATIVLTQINFAYNIGYAGGGANISDIGMMIILARNLLILVLTYLVIRCVFQSFRSKSTDDESAPDDVIARPWRRTQSFR